jgi:hypothetical protein
MTTLFCEEWHVPIDRNQRASPGLSGEQDEQFITQQAKSNLMRNETFLYDMITEITV